MGVIGFPLRKRVRNRLKMQGLHVCDKKQSTCATVRCGEGFESREGERAGREQTQQTIARASKITEVQFTGRGFFVVGRLLDALNGKAPQADLS
jgi:hypothetical protein